MFLTLFLSFSWTIGIVLFVSGAVIMATIEVKWHLLWGTITGFIMLTSSSYGLWWLITNA